MRAVALLTSLLAFMAVAMAAAVTTTWCVARSDASVDALQTALDYACGTGGADCTPLQANGLCFLPNTIQAHASYAFNSYYQRRSNAPGSCDFSSSATVAQSDPSYGSCVYPSSLSTAGGSVPTTNSMNNPTPLLTPPAFGNGNSGLSPPFPDNADDDSRASREKNISILKLTTTLWFVFVLPFLIFS